MRRRRGLMFLAAMMSLTLVAAACGDDDDDDDGASPTTQGTDDTEPPTDGPKACQVTDTGGIDDRSFNETAYAGLERAEDELGSEISFLESQGPEDYEPFLNQFLQEECELIITVGFLLGDATQAAAEANPDQPFAIVDFAYDPPIDNVLGLTFQTDEAAFLAGYLAAGMTETGTVGTYGGLNIPTVTIFMDGFAAGIAHHNAEKGTDVQLLGWDPEGQTGQFTDDFEDQDKGRQVTESLISEGADIIMPVAGPVGLGSVAAVQGTDALLIWVDTDGCVSVADSCSVFLSSVMKNMDVAVFDAVQAVADGTFEGGVYSGTLENEGVDLAPYNEFEDEVPDELKSEIEDLRQQIIDGSLSVSG